MPFSMNWDWEKLEEKRQRKAPGPQGPDLDMIAEKFKQFKGGKFPGLRVLIIVAILFWVATGFYIVEPDEVGVVQRFGAMHAITQPGPHYHFPYPIEKVTTPKVTQIRQIDIGLHSIEESQMLTGDENIVDVQFIVQYQIKDAEKYLFNILEPQKTIKDAAEAAMREVIGYNKIDAALTTDKSAIQNDTRELLQEVLDRYGCGINVVAVKMQDVHPPQQVIDAFKDVASAKEDKSRFINESEAYRNDLIPTTRGEVATLVKEAEAYNESVTRKAKGESARFLALFEEYRKAKEVTTKRLYLETMEEVLGSPGVDKIIISDETAGRVLPYLPLDRLSAGGQVPAGRTTKEGEK